MIPTKITIELHENYVQVKVRFTKETSISYVEYSLCGANVFELLLQGIDENTLRARLESFVEEHRDVKKTYLTGFVGHFSLTYEIEPGNVSKFNAIDARLIRPVSGGQTVTNGFRNKAFRDRIFSNLINSVINKDVNKLNGIMDALRNI